jgi:hypothetical protein
MIKRLWIVEWKEYGKVRSWLNSKRGYFVGFKRTEAQKTQSRGCIRRLVLAGWGQTRYPTPTDFFRQSLALNRNWKRYERQQHINIIRRNQKPSESNKPRMAYNPLVTTFNTIKSFFLYRDTQLHDVSGKKKVLKRLKFKSVRQSSGCI